VGPEQLLPLSIPMKNIFLLILMFVTSCQSTKKTMDYWRGHSKQELLTAWGIPDKTSDNGTTEMLLFSETIYVPAGTYAWSNSSYTRTPSRTYWRYRIFFVKDNKIVDWKIETGQIPPTEIDLNIYRY